MELSYSSRTSNRNRWQIATNPSHELTVMSRTSIGRYTLGVIRMTQVGRSP
jgi:hypothetical protein